MRTINFLHFLLVLALGLPLLANAQSGAAPQSFGDPSVWRWAPSRTYHVKNYKLRLRFRETEGEVLGDEIVTLKPFSDHFRRFYLDSAGLTIESVSLESPGPATKLAYATEAARLWITLPQEDDSRSTLTVRIVYHGFPQTGLFFVNPTKDYPNWPQEIYSQGEPEFNHYWFPCWDYPNDMATSETITTVPEGQTVVSNGRLMNVTHSAGDATYDWLESVPHSSYLISIAVGPWRKVPDQYQNKPVDYYVPKYVSDAAARRSFHLTPDMIGFFSRMTGLDYPYEQYAQTAVRNFIFGGQENVSATTLNESLALHDAQGDADYPSTDLISHELGQHWFGDYVQGHDWADIWLNEGFATYLEALYTQHHEGNDAFRYAIYQDQLTEQAEERSYVRPIVDWHYSDPLDMFDATTHEKGAVVLEMLRYLVDGPEADAHEASQNESLFRAFHYYLTDHRAQTAHTADLLSAIEHSTGLELGWFFHEWVFMAGHPEYHVQATYDPARKTEKVTVQQTQTVSTLIPVFDMPIEIEFFGAPGQRKKIQVRNNLQHQEYEIPLDFAPQWVDFDPEDFIDKTLTFEQPFSALVAEAENDPSMMSRLWAVQQLAPPNRTMASENADRISALNHALETDEFYAVRAAAAKSLGEIRGEKAKGVLLAALDQQDSRVRQAVVEALGQFSNDAEVFDKLVDKLHHDASYLVQAAAAHAIGVSANARAFSILQAEAAGNPEVHVMKAVLAALAATHDARAVGVLLADAHPGVTEQVRSSALAGLIEEKTAINSEHERDELSQVARAGLSDPYLPVRMAAEEVVGAFGLTQYEPEIQKDADAPLVFQRRLAQTVLAQLHHTPNPAS